MAYTYRIKWIKLNKSYYGVRYSKKSEGIKPEDDLWIKYFTSSNVVKEYRKTYGEPDIIEIRKVFDDKQDSVKWEKKVLERLKASKSLHWLNVQNGANVSEDIYIPVKERDTGIYIGAVPNTHPLYLSGDYVHYLKDKPNYKLRGRARPEKDIRYGYVTVRLKSTKEWKSITKDEYKNNKELYDTNGSLYINCIDENGDKIKVSREEFKNNDNLKGHLSGNIIVKDGDKNIIISRDDPRYLSGKLVHFNKGVKIKNPESNSRPKEKNGRWSGISDADYIEMIIENIKKYNNTLRWKQLCKMVKLPSSRRHIKATIESKYNLPLYRNKK